MSTQTLSDRFVQLRAPEGFSPNHGISLRWFFPAPKEQRFVDFDPKARSGFFLRVGSLEKTDDIDIAFHANGKIARFIENGQVTLDEELQEKKLSKILIGE